MNGRRNRKFCTEVQRLFRLLQIAEQEKKIETSGLVNESIQRFLNEIKEETIPLKQIGVPFDMDEALGYLRSIYM